MKFKITYSEDTTVPCNDTDIKRMDLVDKRINQVNGYMNSKDHLDYVIITNSRKVIHCSVSAFPGYNEMYEIRFYTSCFAEGKLLSEFKNLLIDQHKKNVTELMI